MRHAPITWVAAILIGLFCTAWASAAPKPQPDKPPSPAGNFQHPPPANHNHSPHSSIHHYGGYYPVLGDSYGDSSYYGNYYALYPYQPYYYAYPPPVFFPAEQLFGPQAAMRFFGMDQGQANAGPWRGGKDAKKLEPKKSADRATNAQAIALAMKFIGYGDALFAKQKFAEANDRYRKASTSAPQLADTWFRQGFALAAMGRYELALGAIKRGLKLNPKWPQSAFEIDELYGPDAMSKTAHLDALANAAEGKPNDADLLFLIGVRLHFDGQADRAKAFFQRAAQLAGNDAEHIRAFLKNGK